MATSSISLHQKKLEFEDNQFLSSLFGYHDKNLKVLEDKFKVKSSVIEQCWRRHLFLALAKLERQQPSFYKMFDMQWG